MMPQVRDMKQWLRKTIVLLALAIMAIGTSSTSFAASYSSGGRSYSSHSSSFSSGGSHSFSSGGSSSHTFSGGGSSSHTFSSGGGSSHIFSGGSTHTATFGGSSFGSSSGGSKSFSTGGGKSYSAGSSWSDTGRKSYSSGKSYNSGSDRSYAPAPSDTWKPTTSTRSSASPPAIPSSAPAAPPRITPAASSSGMAFDTAAARARQQDSSKQDFARFKESQLPPKPSVDPRPASYSVRPPPIPTTPRPVYVPAPVVIQTRPARIYTVFNPYYSRPIITYSDPYSSLFWWWLLDRSLDEQAYWAYHHRYDMDPARYQALLSHDAQLESRIAALEAQQVPRNPTYVPPTLGQQANAMYSMDDDSTNTPASTTTSTTTTTTTTTTPTTTTITPTAVNVPLQDHRDLMYSDRYVTHAYSHRPSLVGTIAFWFFGIPLIVGVCALFIWLIWFKRWQTSPAT
jgi:hypothetical protein